MKKQIITLTVLAGLTFAAVPALTNRAVSAKAATSAFGINKISNQLEQFYGTGVLIELQNLTFPDGQYPTVYDSTVNVNNKIHFTNRYLEDQDCKLMGLGASLLMNQNSPLNYYGSVLKFDSGFSFDFDNTTYSLNKSATFVCKINNGTGGAYWTKTTAPGLNAANDEVSVKVGCELDLGLQVSSSDTSPIVSYKSQDESIVTVNNNGTIVGIKEGNTTVTAYCVTEKFVFDVTVEASDVPQTGIKVTTKEITTYTGYDFDINDLRVVSMFGDIEGSSLPITKANIFGDYNYNVAGDYTLTVAIDSFQDTFTLHVVDLPAASVGTTKGADFGNNSGWGDLYIMTNIPDTAHYLNIKNEALDKLNSMVLVNGEPDKLRDVKNLGGGRYEFWFKNNQFKPGDVVEILKGLPIYQFSGSINGANHEPDFSTGHYYMVAETKVNLKYVYTGTEWDIYVGEPEAMNVECPTYISVNEQVKISWSVSPVGTYGTPVFTSDNENIVKVDALGTVVGVSVGKATITATLGSLMKAFEITVAEQKEVKGIKFIEIPNYFSVLKGSDPALFKPAITKAQLVFVDNTFGPVFEFASTNISVGILDTSVEGEVELPATLSYAGKTYHSSITVNVYDYYDQKVSEIGIVDWFIYSTFLQLPNTCTNIANLTGGAGMIPGIYDNISYTRADGTEVPLEVIYQLGANIALFPEFLFDENGNGALDADNFNEYYLPGDTITVNAMTPVYKWTGDLVETSTDNHAMAANTGEIIVEGFITDRLQYRYDGNVWGLYIQYDDIAIANDTIDVMIGQTKSAGATRVPSNATSGTFTYVSSDTSVATVTSGGVIKGVSEGTCTITVTLSEEGRESKVGTITVNVTDGIKSLKVEGGLQVTQGTKELDLSKLEAKFVWASGKEEAADLTNATVSGFDGEKLGKQNVAIKVTVDGKEFTAKIVVEVVAKKGCGGSIIATTGIVALVSTLGIVLVSLKKKEDK